MICQDIARLDSAYVDGELDTAQAEAFRAHLRQCTACRQATHDLATMVDVASQLPPVDPPEHLWAAIRRELQPDAADAADAHDRGADRRRAAPADGSPLGGFLDRLVAWLSPHWRLASLGAVAAVALLLVWSVGGDRDAPGRVPITEPHIALDHGPGATYAETLTDELHAADEQYSDTIAELRAMVEEERGSWPTATGAAYDQRLRQFQDAAARHQQALAFARVPSPGDDRAVADPRGRDALYEVYRAEIAFLQQVAIDGPPTLPQPGGPR